MASDWKLYGNMGPDKFVLVLLEYMIIFRRCKYLSARTRFLNIFNLILCFTLLILVLFTVKAQTNQLHMWTIRGSNGSVCNVRAAVNMESILAGMRYAPQWYRWGLQGYPSVRKQPRESQMPGWYQCLGSYGNARGNHNIMMTSSNGTIFRVTGQFGRGIHRSPVNSSH